MSTINLFEPLIWAFLITTLVFMVILLYLIHFVWKSCVFINLLWLIFETLLQQSTSCVTTINVLSFEILYTFWLIFSLIFSIIFGNCIYSRMMSPSKLNSIDTIEKLAHEKLQGHITVSSYGQGSVYKLMRVMREI